MSSTADYPTTGQAYSRRHFLHVAGAVTGSAVLAACGGTQQSTSPQAQITPVGTAMPGPEASATIAAAIGKTYFPSGDPDVPDAFTAPLPPYQSVRYVPGIGGTTTGFTVFYSTPPLPLGQNKYWQQLNKTLNTSWEPVFAFNSDGYIQKSATLVAGGSPPDLFMLWPEVVPSLYQAIEQGAFNDLTPYLSGSALQEYPNLARISPTIWNNSRLNGKIYGVPRPRFLKANPLYIRADWMKKVGITQPKDENEFYTLMTEITNGKLNNGQQTWGLAGLFGAGVYSWIFSIFEPFNNYRLEADGSLTNHMNTPEFLDAMAYLRKLYQAGVFYPNSPSLTLSQAMTAFVSGKAGGVVNGPLNITTASQLSVTAQVQQVNPQAEVAQLLPPGAGGRPPTPFLTDGGFFARVGIPSRVSDPARIKTLLRILDYFAAPAFSLEYNFLSYGIPDWDYTRNANGIPKQTPVGQKELNSLAYIMNGPYTFFAPYDPPGIALQLQNFVRDCKKTGVADPTLGHYSPTAVKQSSVLGQLWTDRFLRIVTGVDPVSSAKLMYTDWLSHGGTQILQELTTALHKSK